MTTGKATKAEFADEYVRNRDIIKLIEKTKVDVTDRLTSTEAIVEIVLDDGDVLSRQIDTEKLEIPEDKIASGLETKFLSLLPPSVTHQKAENLIKAVMNLEEIPDIRDVVRLLPPNA